MAHHSPTDVSLEFSEQEPILSDAQHYIVHNDDDGSDGGSHDDVHIASEAEKKRLWWRNAAINTCFILSWYDSLALPPSDPIHPGEQLSPALLHCGWGY
jgi:solute carrier family 35 protein C2